VSEKMILISKENLKSVLLSALYVEMMHHSGIEDTVDFIVKKIEEVEE
jgi:hypothetical protein